MGIFGELLKAGINSDGTNVSIPGLNSNIGRGKTFYADASVTTSGNGTAPRRAINSLATAFAKLTSGRNDQLRVLASASALNLAAGLDWNINCAHMIGEGSFGRMNQRSRIGHSANFATLFTVSGYGNSFHNLFFAHGRGSATNLTALLVTGARNSFINCHFGGPYHATEAGTAGYRLVKLQSSETYFKGCTFGGDTIPPTAAISYVEFGAQADPPRVVFENCTFLTRVTAAGGQGATFFKVIAGCGEGLAEFINCRVLNIGSAALTVGIDGAGLSNFRMHFSNHPFVGCTDVVAAAQESYVSFDGAAYTAAATSNGLGALADNT